MDTRTVPPPGLIAPPAMSYDGRRVYWRFAGGNYILSTNWGVAWTTNSIGPITNIASIACSYDGSRVAVAANNGIYYSSNAGKDWGKTAAPEDSWSNIAMSADGTKLVAVDSSGQSGIYRSSDSGVSWAAVKPDGSWFSIASSADGAVLVAAGGNNVGLTVISTNSGTSWNEVAGQRIEAVAISGDGSKMIASPRTTHSVVLISTNTGATWFQHNYGGATGISADGKTMFVRGAAVHRYDPEEERWVDDFFTGLTGVGLSGDGKIMVASHQGGISVRSEERPLLRNPVTLTIWPLTNLFLTVRETGALPITNHWFFNDQPIAGGEISLQFTPTNSGVIKVTAENAFGTVTAIDTILNVLPAGVRMAIGSLQSFEEGWQFKAYVAPGLEETALWFEWGLDTNYGHFTAPTNVAPGSMRYVSQPPPTLNLGVYHVRAIASNSLGMAVSGDARFVPLPITAGMDTGTPGTGSTRSWFEQGYAATNRDLGLPVAGSIFTSQSENASYQMPADYGAPNAVLVDSREGGTLHLVAPASWSQLSFLTSAGSGDVVIRYLLRHTDDSTETGTFTSNDWMDGTNTAFTANARLWPSGYPLTFPTNLWNIVPETANPKLYGRTITVTDTTNPIRDIELSYVSGSGHAVIFAVSGSTGGAFVPIAITGFNQDMVVEAAFSGEPQLVASTPAAGYSGVIRALPGVPYEIWATDSLESTNWSAITIVTNVISLTPTKAPIGPIDHSKPAQFFKVRPR